MKRIMNCNCGHIEGKKRIPHSHSSSFGITIKDMGPDYVGTFIDNKSFSLENNYCPQCGVMITKIDYVVEIDGE